MIRNSHKVFFTAKFFLAVVFLFDSFTIPSITQAQVRAGAGYLKIMPGARQFGVAGAQAGALDYSDSFFANPAATGFLREWQWSASYTNWISDMYNTSFLAARRFRLPWSEHARVALGVSYFGIPEFNSTDAAVALASGNDLLATLGVGQPLSVLSPNLSLGANVKYFNSELAQFSATAWIFDFGLLYRTPRFRLSQSGDGFFEHAIFSAGLAFTNLGSGIRYVDEKTPLPLALRTGVALNLGAHDGLQFSLASDYNHIRDEDGFFAIGTEVSWRQWVTLRAGYNFENNIFGAFTFGASFRFDDRLTPIKQLLPGRNNALRLDLAARQNSDFVSSPYDGSIGHFPIRPESFRLIEPIWGAKVDADSVELKWQATRDPDLYDEVGYWLLVDRDSLKIASLLEIAEQDDEAFLVQLENQKLLVNQRFSQTQFEIADLVSGSYFWSVFAYDRDNHIRVAEIDKRRISRFDVTGSDVQITSIDFAPSQWITEDDLQGNIKITVVNRGDRVIRGYSLAIYDSILTATNGVINPAAAELQNNLLAKHALPDIRPDSSVTLAIEWHTFQAGLHNITAIVSQFSRKAQRDETMHQLEAEFYTIPKGAFSAPDSAVVRIYRTITYELPVVGKIYFDSSSAEIKPEFIRQWLVKPPLQTLAERLAANPQMKISVQGSADPNSDENDVAIADARAAALRDSLVQLGVRPVQVEFVPGMILPVRKLPADHQDALWLLQERRRVDITTDATWEEFLFGPSQSIYKDTTATPVAFLTDIASAVPLSTSSVRLTSGALADSLAADILQDGQKLMGEIKWQPSQKVDDWMEKFTEYQVVVIDTLGRRFMTAIRNIYLDLQTIERERMYFGIARFAVAEPFYNFYWDNLLERIPAAFKDETTRLRFIGHACAIGPVPINDKLSQKRAELFHQKVMGDLKQRYPELYAHIQNRIDKPESFGETKPFEIKLENGQAIVLGNNQMPLGRQLNRRVIALFYSLK